MYANKGAILQFVLSNHDYMDDDEIQQKYCFFKAPQNYNTWDTFVDEDAGIERDIERFNVVLSINKKLEKFKIGKNDNYPNRPESTLIEYTYTEDEDDFE